LGWRGLAPTFEGSHRSRLVRYRERLTRVVLLDQLLVVGGIGVGSVVIIGVPIVGD
jgi:hypothetical protein